MTKINYNDEYCGSVAASNNNINDSVKYHFDCGINSSERWVIYDDLTAEKLYNWYKASKGKFPITIKEIRGFHGDLYKGSNGGWYMEIVRWPDYTTSVLKTYIGKRLVKNRFNEIVYYIEMAINKINNAAQTEEATTTETKDKEPQIHEILVISAIKDAIKTNSTDEYSVGGGYTISINEEHIKVSVPNENRTIDYHISDWATEDEWLFNKEEVIKKIAKNIMGDIYIDPNGYDGVPTFEQSQFAINALMED